jgi:hypothetical protein
MRFSFEEFHIWHQFANSLICARKVSTLLFVRECDVYTIYTYYVGTAVCIMLSHSDFPTAFLGLNIGLSPNVKKAFFFFQFHRGKFPIAW